VKYISVNFSGAVRRKNIIKDLSNFAGNVRMIL